MCRKQKLTANTSGDNGNVQPPGRVANGSEIVQEDMYWHVPLAESGASVEQASPQDVPQGQERQVGRLQNHSWEHLQPRPPLREASVVSLQADAVADIPP